MSLGCLKISGPQSYAFTIISSFEDWALVMKYTARIKKCTCFYAVEFFATISDLSLYFNATTEL